MKTLFTFILIVSSIVYSNAQDLLLSENFDYPIGSTLNQNNWKPLTSATDNPIKIVAGLSQENYPASGGAAYLNKNGQDVIRSFQKTSYGLLFFNFQIKVYHANKQVIPYYQSGKQVSQSNYFMFLSNKEEPTKPQLKFVIQDTEIIYGAENRVANGYDGVTRNLYVLNANDEMISSATFYTKNETTSFTILYSLATGEINIGQDDYNYPFLISLFSTKNKLKITNLSNITLSQSDRNVGSIATIDRIKIGKTWNSILPCGKDFTLGAGVYKYDDKDKITYFNPTGTTYITPLDIQHLPKEWYEIANTEVTKPIFRYFISRPDITDLSVEVSDGFKISINGGSISSKGTVSINKTYSDDFNTYIDFYLVGDTKILGPNNKPIVGKAGIYEGKAVIGTNLGCLATTINLKGIVKNSPVSSLVSTSLNATVFPNTSNGKLDLLINDKAPEGEFDIKLSDNAGNDLFQNSGNWESLKPNIEQILSKNRSGQYFFTVKQGNESKTIRVFRQE